MTLILGHQPVTSIPDADLVHEMRDERGRLWFHPGVNRNTRQRQQAVRCLVLHWVGSENPAASTARYLRDQALDGRGLSCDFIVDKGSLIHQTADPLVTQCAHAGSVINPRSAGIEITSRGFATRADVRGEDLRERTELDWSEPRDVYTDTIGVRRTRMVAFTPEQVQSVTWLVETLCGLLDIPRIIPWRYTVPGEEELPHAVPYRDRHAVPLFDRDPGRHRRSRRATFEGVLGHFHVHKSKWDPGTQLFYRLWAEGFNPAGIRHMGDLPPMGAG